MYKTFPCFFKLQKYSYIKKLHKNLIYNTIATDLMDHTFYNRGIRLYESMLDWTEYFFGIA